MPMVETHLRTILLNFLMDIFNLEEWDEETLQSLIDNGIEESAYLEFKRSDALAKSDGKKDEIAKDVSAFANSDGGILIYGINEVNHKAESFDFVDGNEFNKEWLELVITTAITRKIDGIKIFPVRFNNDIRQSVYIIKIPISYSAPHMVSRKKTYYKRNNFSAVPMEEYEVRHTYDRKENVKLEICMIAIENTHEINNINYAKINFVKVHVNIKNTSSRIAKDYKVVVKLYNNSQIEFKPMSITSYNRTVLADCVSISTDSKVAIFPNEEIRIMSFGLEAINRLVFNSVVDLGIDIYTEREILSRKEQIKVKGQNGGLFAL